MSYCIWHDLIISLSNYFPMLSAFLLSLVFSFLVPLPEDSGIFFSSASTWTVPSAFFCLLFLSPYLSHNTSCACYTLYYQADSVFLLAFQLPSPPYVLHYPCKLSVIISIWLLYLLHRNSTAICMSFSELDPGAKR